MEKIGFRGLLAALCGVIIAPVHAASPVATSPVQRSASEQIAGPDAEEELTLRVNDAIVRPGGVAAAVFRTYKSRGVGSGQICVAVRRSLEAGGPTITYLGAEVFNPEDNAVVRLIVEPDEAMIRFAAPLPTINSVDGPLAVLYYRVTGVLPDQEFDVAPMIDSFMIDANGDEIPLELRAGRLRIADRSDDFEISGAAEDTVPGEVALLSIQTAELRLLSSGTLALRFDPSIASGPPTVRVDSRHGSVIYDTEGSLPSDGLIIVNFTSPANDYNRVPGDIMEVMVPTRADIPIGTRSPVRPVASLTTVVDPQGRRLPLDFEAENLVFVAPQ
jgi:hypothetical protein